MALRRHVPQLLLRPSRRVQARPFLDPILLPNVAPSNLFSPRRTSSHRSLRSRFRTEDQGEIVGLGREPVGNESVGVGSEGGEEVSFEMGLFDLES